LPLSDSFSYRTSEDNLAIDPSRPRNTYCLTDKIPKVCYTFIYFANNQLSPRSISFSLLPTNHPRLLQQSRVRSSQVLLQSCSTCSWVDHAVSGPIMIYLAPPPPGGPLVFTAVSLAYHYHLQIHYTKGTLFYSSCSGVLDFRIYFTSSLNFFSTFPHGTFSLSVCISI